jgi:DNA-directed RNA polymerase subunit M/transcription elongation factor TFIIS
MPEVGVEVKMDDSWEQEHPVPPTEPDWMTCRATPECKGRMAVVTVLQEHSFVDGGGVSRRYQCTTCKGVWHLRS